MANFTDVQIKHWIRTGEPIAKALGDVSGLTFTLSANGTAAWVLRYRFGGKPREYSIGRYPEYSIVKAKAAALEARARIQGGEDVARDKRIAKIERAAAKGFRQLAEDYKEKAFPKLAANTVKQRRHHIDDILVPRLATHKNGETVEAMQECFHTIGYDCEWRILNAAHYGVPQKRERLIMIGVERGGKIIFPPPTHHSSSPTIGYRDKSKMVFPVQCDLFNKHIKLHDAVTVMDAISDLPQLDSGEEATKYTSKPLNDYQRERRLGVRSLSLHNATEHSRKMLEIIRHSGKNIDCIPRHLISSGFSTSYSRLDPHEPAVTITVNFVHPASNKCIHPFQQRALTPREGARLQSFDDGFEFVGNRTQIVKQIGNAVPPLLGKAIGVAVEKMLS